jgi:hypothetical protein
MLLRAAGQPDPGTRLATGPLAKARAAGRGLVGDPALGAEKLPQARCAQQEMNSCRWAPAPGSCVPE